jgi:nitrous oxide reductase accessory protein NosL
MMKKNAYIACIIAVSVLIAGFAFAQDDTAQHKSCKYCGMDREKFAQSRMLIEYDDGTKVGTCSIHCSAVDLSLNIDKTPVTIWVGDFMTKKLVDAEKAYWVIGGSKPGVMTKKAKWAFASKEDADKFMKENGGTAANFEQAIKTSYEDMYDDSKMIREKRKKMKEMKAGGHQH